MPFFSIILPTYNRAHQIRTTIEHVLSQDFDDFELIVVDDGSKDNTEKEIRGFSDPRIQYRFKKNEERAIARNTGIRMASGDYVTFLDSDDELYSNCLSTALELCQENNYPAWMHLNYEIKDQSGRVLKEAPERKGDLVKQLVTGNHLSCLGVFVKKEILDKEKFDEDPRLIGSEDYDLWLRIAKKFPLSYSNEVVAAIIQHRDRSVLGFSGEKLVARINYLVQKHQKLGTFGNKDYCTFVANRYMYLALHLSILRNLRRSAYYILKALITKPIVIISKKFLGIIKTFLIK